jgi:hypothetical protein
MAYFSNGTEGHLYQERYCNRCVHDLKQGCPVWALHLAFNGEQHDKQGNRAGTVHDFLNTLIPMDGIHAGECRLFHEATPEEKAEVKHEESVLRGINKPAPWIAEWLATRGR